MRRSTMPLTGGAIALLGAWGGIVPFAGPAFGYPMPAGSHIPAWQWTASHWQLHVVAGCAAIVGGALVALARRRGAATGGALLGLLGGAWFVLGPVFQPVWTGGGGMMKGGSMGMPSAWMQAVTPLGYHYGTGLLIALLSAFALTRLASPRHRAVAEPAPVADERATGRFRRGAPAVEREPTVVR